MSGGLGDGLGQDMVTPNVTHSTNICQGSTCSYPRQRQTMVMTALVTGAGTGHRAPLERDTEETTLNVRQESPTQS